jgi:ribonuclease D
MTVDDTPVHLVSDGDGRDLLLAAIDAADFLALDTEFFRERSYYPRLALLQIATPETVWLVDPLAGIDLCPLWERLVTIDIPVVLHAADQDLDLILAEAGRLPRQVFDTQIAAELLGLGTQPGYAALVETMLGVHLDKALVRSDWLARPLSPKQLEYAVQDVLQLRHLYPLLRDGLERAGRWSWMEEESARQTDPARFAPADRHLWKKVRGVQTLDRAGLAVLRVLAACREEIARERDRPRRWVWDDQALLDLAHRIARLPSPVKAQAIVPLLVERRGPLKGASERGRELAEAIAHELDRPPGDWPEPRRGPRLPPEDRELLESRRTRLEQLAERESIAPSRLATSAELKQDLADPDRPSRLNRGWRADLLAPLLQDDRQPDSPDDPEDYPQMTDNEIIELIQAELPDARVRPDGEGCNFRIAVTSEAFVGKSLLQQHQMLNRILKPALESGRLHAVTYDTRTPDH